ncbi:MAG: pyridoxal-phosphate dependent enzyme, partial [Actinomycetia bacterium]|nr:pyridoxal-phosphate dependent enzyme [Actinomycetes bacterium]
SSGTYALGLGMICAELGLPFHIYSDPAIDDVLQRRLEDLGGTVTLVSKDYSGANLQVQRLAGVKKRLADHPGTFWPCQYDNPENRVAYRAVAEQLRHHLGDRFTLVGTVGSGGSTGGVAEVLRDALPELKLVAVDTFGSVLFGLPNGRRMLRGLGNSLLPQNLRHELYDEIHWVTAEDGYYHTRRLHRTTALYMGPTSGAAFQVADWLAAEHPEETVVFIAPDEGYRYAESVYDDAWLREQGLLITEPTPAPTSYRSLVDVEPSWARFPWSRRAFGDIPGVTHPDEGA